MKTFKTFRDFINEVKYTKVVRKLMSDKHTPMLRVYINDDKIVAFAVIPIRLHKPTILEPGDTIPDIRIKNGIVAVKLLQIMQEEKVTI